MVTRYRGWLWIHAGKKLDLDAVDMLHLSVDEFSRGGLLGLAKLEGLFDAEYEEQWLRLRGEHLSPGWVFGPMLWVAVFRRPGSCGDYRMPRRTRPVSSLTRYRGASQPEIGRPIITSC